MTTDEQTDYSDRRKYPRYEIVQRAKIYYDEQRVADVVIADISYEGLCLEAQGDVLRHMLPPIDAQAGYDKIPLRLNFEITLDDQNYQIQLLLSSVYLKPLASNLSQMGVEIVDVEEGILEFSDYIVSLRGSGHN